MGRPNIDGPLSFGVNPRLSAAATRKREFVHAVAIHDCKAQVTVGRHTFDGTDQVPHPPLLNRAEYSTLIWTVERTARFIRRENVKHYRLLLETVTDEQVRQEILKLLAEEQGKQRAAGDPIED